MFYKEIVEENQSTALVIIWKVDFRTIFWLYVIKDV